MNKSIEVNGFCNPAFLPIQEAFVRNFENDLELGASVAVTVGDDLAVDLWAGYSDRKKTKPWAEDTIVQVFSTTKVMTILSILLLIDRGQLDIDTPVAKYWPEFAQQGKENVLVRHVLNHSSGFLHGMRFTRLNRYLIGTKW